MNDSNSKLEKDPLSNSPFKVVFGRPNFENLFSKISEKS